jgi:hypothetical protein
VWPYKPLNEIAMEQYLQRPDVKQYMKETHGFEWDLATIKRYVEHFDGQFEELKSCLDEGLDSTIEQMI